MSTKEEQTATFLLDLTRLLTWLPYYCNIYLIETKGHQSGRRRRGRGGVMMKGRWKVEGEGGVGKWRGKGEEEGGVGKSYK